jgi:hypothetical protein
MEALCVDFSALSSALNALCVLVGTLASVFLGAYLASGKFSPSEYYAEEDERERVYWRTQRLLACVRWERARKVQEPASTRKVRVDRDDTIPTLPLFPEGVSYLEAR